MTRRYTPWHLTTDPLLRTIFRQPYKERQKLLVERFGYPKHLYRYTSLNPEDPYSVDQLKQVLIESLLWLSSPADFNDPFDMSAHVVFDGSGPQKRAALTTKFKEMTLPTTWKKRNQRINELLTKPEETLQYIRSVFRKALQEAGVCCFTTDPTNLLMWSHYADNHKGLVLEFDPAQDPDVLTGPVKVSYSDDYPVINWLNDTKSQLQKTMLQKAKVWEYEKEWRLIHPDGSRTHQCFKHAGLTAVVMGCRVTEATKAKLHELLDERERCGYPAVRLYQAEMHGTRYEIVLQEPNG